MLVGLLVALIFYRGWSERRPDITRAALITAGITLAGFGAYLAFNFNLLGYPFQISGTVKMSQGIVAINQDGGFLSARMLSNVLGALRTVLGTMKWHLTSVLLPNGSPNLAILVWWIPLVAALTLVVRDVAHSGHLEMRRVAIVPSITWVEVALLAFTVIQTGLYVTLLRRTVPWTPWYLVPQILIGVLVVAWVLGRPQHGGIKQDTENPQLLRIGLCVIAFVGAGVIYTSNQLSVTSTTSTWNTEGVKLARWVQSDIPASARIGAWDTGLWAYFSERPIINLDGLMNDYRFFNEYERMGRINEYVDDEHIDYLITWTDSLSQCRAYQIKRCMSGEVVYRTSEWPVTGGRAGVQVVRLSEN
ncbi:MAG: hypothetical protein HZB53_09025 [Chloroflexi bacterium]|nr:hypothetical protein [Chloroflexota bacterium]